MLYQIFQAYFKNIFYIDIIYMLSTTDTINKFTQSAGQSGPAFTISNFTNQVNTEVINNGEYAVSGYEVYAIRNTTPYSDTPNLSRNGLDATGSFTITCTETADISIILGAGGGAGISHSQGSGGPSAGQVRYIKVTLQPGNYTCDYTVGVGGSPGFWSGTAPNTAVNNGRNSILTLNGQTYTSYGGVCSGKTIYLSGDIVTYYSNGTLYGGAGRSALIRYVGSVAAYKGTAQTYYGGSVSNNNSNGVCSGAGGAGNSSNGGNGSMSQIWDIRASGPSGKGGAPIHFNNYAEFNFDSGIKYFGEGGCGSTVYNYQTNFVIPENVDVPPRNDMIVGGRGSGIKTMNSSHPGAAYACTDAVQHTCSGGGSGFSLIGRINSQGQTTNVSGHGSNGIIIISFAA